MAIVIALSMAGASLSGCSSGGGGGGGGYNDDGIHNPKPEPEPNPEPKPEPEPEPEPPPETTGNPTLVGVADSGFRVTHEAYRDDIISTIGVVNGNTDVSQDEDHGTGVAGTISARLDEVDFIFAKVGIPGENGDTMSKYVDHGVGLMAEADARVINVSYSGRAAAPSRYFYHDGISSLDSMRKIITSNNGLGSVNVAAAGNANEALAEARPIYQEADIYARTLLVGASTGEDKAFYSNYPGSDTAYQSRFLTAPGATYAPTANADDTYANWIGTSFAAPKVSAYASTLIQRWPHMSAVDVSQLLLDTADKSSYLYGKNDCGDAGNLNCGYYYLGQGEADLDAAMDPQGELTVPWGNHLEDGGYRIDGSHMRLSSAYGATSASQALADIAVFDDLGRDYSLGFGSVVYQEDGYSDRLADKMARIAPGARDQRISSQASAGRFGFQMTQTAGGDLASSRLEMTTDNLHLAAYGFQGDERQPDPARGFGTLPMMSFEGGSVMTQHLGDVHGVSAASTLLGPMQLRADYWQGDSETDTADGYSASRADLSVSLPVDDALALTMGIGHSSERHGILGATGSGAFTLAKDNDMRFAHLGLDYTLADSLSGFAYYEQGRGEAAGSGLVEQIDDIKSQEFSLGLQWQGSQQDAMLAFSQPARIDQANLTLNVPVGRDMAGNVQRERRAVSLAPTGQQRDIEVGYARRLANDAALQVNLLYTLDPGHDASAEDVATIVAGFTKAF